jgi:geranylgeranyl diphosphate synthase, type II
MFGEALQTDLAKTFIRLKKQINDGLAVCLPNQEPQSLYGPMRYAMAGGGKQLRPLLLLLSCEAVGGNSTHALPAAMALELVHNFTLVHDDIMDHDELRRGRETVYKKWEENTAILAGDGLLVQAFAALVTIETDLLPRVLAGFTSGIMEVCEGQAMDKEFESRPTVALEEYYIMISKKTGRLFSLACEMGGVLGRGQQEQVQGLADYGALLGRAFQIQDDVLDVWAEEGVLGKDIGSDIRENKKSYLMAHLFEYGPVELQQEIREMSQQKELTPQDIKRAIALFIKAGTLRAAETEIDRCIKNAEAALKPLTNLEAKGRLGTLLTLLAHRKF